jgi:AraC-like DNA-binding protein
VNNPYQAQGIDMPWIGLMGYNINLRDFDLRIPPGSRLCTIVLNKEQLMAHHQLQCNDSLTVDRWHNTNQLELRGLSGQQLRKKLEVLIQKDTESSNRTTADQLMKIIIKCFENTKAKTMGSNKREERHTAAISLLHWYSNHPRARITVDKLCEELYQSRTSLFTGCKEHFRCTPHELQRAIRLDRVRSMLRQPADRERLGLKSIQAIARHFGFHSQSHFVKRYQQHFGAKPEITHPVNEPKTADLAAKRKSRTFGLLKNEPKS